MGIGSFHLGELLDQIDFTNGFNTIARLFKYFLLLPTGFIVFFSILAGISAIIPLTLYILGAIGMHSVAIDRGLENHAIFAFIPILRWFLIGEMQGEITLFDQKIQPLKFILPITMCVASLMSSNSISSIVTLAASLFLILVNYEIMKKYEPRYAVLYAIFSGIGYFLIYLGLKKNKYTPFSTFSNDEQKAQ
jgi:hypothetical protein